jgi:hypothetical protein
MPHAGARGASLVVKNLPDIKRVFIPEDFGERAGICTQGPSRISQTYHRFFRLMILSPFGWISQESIRPVEVALIRLQPIVVRY